MEPKNPKKSSLHKAMQLSGAGIQMGLTIYLGFLLGQWLDATLEMSFLTETITLAAIFLSMYALIRQVNKLHE